MSSTNHKTHRSVAVKDETMVLVGHLLLRDKCEHLLVGLVVRTVGHEVKRILELDDLQILSEIRHTRYVIICVILCLYDIICVVIFIRYVIIFVMFIICITCDQWQQCTEHLHTHTKLTWSKLDKIKVQKNRIMILSF